MKQADLFAKTTKEIAGFVGRTYKYGGDIRLVVENLEMVSITTPKDPPKDSTRTEERIWEKEVDEFVKRSTYLKENIKTLYSLVWGQCTDIMQQKVEATDIFETMSMEGNGLTLLKVIKDVNYNFQSQKYLPHSLYESKRRFYMCVQGRNMTTQVYLEHFQNMLDVIDHSGGTIAGDSGIENMILNEKTTSKENMNDQQLSELKAEVLERFTAVAFLVGADRVRYGRLVENMENDFLQGRNNYPETVSAAYHLLTNWKQDPRHGLREVGAVGDGVSFHNVNDEDGTTLNNNSENGARKRPKGKAHIMCHRCQKKGHYATECEEPAPVPRNSTTSNPPTAETSTQSATTLLMDGVHEGEFEENVHFQFLNQGGVSLKIGPDGRLPRTWILLDNQSTVDVFHNAELLRNIRVHTSKMDIHCNAGIISTQLVS